MLAALVFHPRSKTRSSCLVGFVFFLIFHSSLLSKSKSRNASEPTTVTRLCLGTRPRVGRAWFPRHASWEQAGRMGHGDRTSRPRAAHVAHAISVRVRLCPRSSGRDKLGTRAFPCPRALTKLTLGPLPSSTYCTDGCFRRKFADRERV